MAMRIITGKAKGKRLATLGGDTTRPTSERIKEALFSSLQFDIENRRVLDLFAGCGQLGLEALSRGAASCMFIDSSREAMEVIKKNAVNTGLSAGCRYLVSDCKNYVRKAGGRERFDLILIDPPYDAMCATDVMLRCIRAGIAAPGAIFVLECGEERPDKTLPEFSSLECLKENFYGKKTALYIFLYRPGNSGADSGESKDKNDLEAE